MAQPAIGRFIAIPSLAIVSRRRKNASVQSAKTRTLRLKEGMRLMWYVRCMNHAGMPLTLMP